MKCITVLSFILITVEIYISTAIEILYVLPDNSTSAVSCPSQPCATLSQYVLDNGTLPVVSNVEYHFLPGEHHVPANMVLRNLYNFSIIGTIINSSSVVLVGCSQWYVINIIDSHFITIKTAMFKQCEIFPVSKKTLTNLRLSCCFSCIIQDITFIQYGLTSYNLIGNSYLQNIKTIQFSQLCCQQILLQYTTCQLLNDYSNYIHNVTINQIFIEGNTTSFLRLYMHLDYSVYHLKIILQNSYFNATNQTALKIRGGSSLTATQLYIINCTFKYISTEIAIIILPLSPINKNVSFINCDFHGNMEVIKIIIMLCKSFNCELLISNATFPMILTNISFVRCQFIDNRQRLLLIENRAPALGKVTCLVLYIFYITHIQQQHSNLL